MREKKNSNHARWCFSFCVELVAREERAEKKAASPLRGVRWSNRHCSRVAGRSFNLYCSPWPFAHVMHARSSFRRKRNLQLRLSSDYGKFTRDRAINGSCEPLAGENLAFSSQRSSARRHTASSHRQVKHNIDIAPIKAHLETCFPPRSVPVYIYGLSFEPLNG